MRKSLFYIFLITSLSFNLYLFLIHQKQVNAKSDKDMLLYAKDISHEEGFKTYKKRFAETSSSNLLTRNNLIYFWDTIHFDFNYKKGMKQLDSLAGVCGKYSFNYIFATEINEGAAKRFLERKGIAFNNFEVYGGMDDFISGVYNEKPSPLDAHFLNGKKTKPTKNNFKRKGYYFFMANDGRILYYNYRIPSPTQNKDFMRKLDSFPKFKKIEM